MKTLLDSINRGTKNSKWLSSHYGELAKKYEGEWVAVLDEKVVAHSKDLKSLRESLRKKYKEAYDELAFDYVTKNPAELIL